MIDLDSHVTVAESTIVSNDVANFHRVRTSHHRRTTFYRNSITVQSSNDNLLASTIAFVGCAALGLRQRRRRLLLLSLHRRQLGVVAVHVQYRLLGVHRLEHEVLIVEPPVALSVARQKWSKRQETYFWYEFQFRFTMRIQLT
jgi:hypothetical protein